MRAFVIFAGLLALVVANDNGAPPNQIKVDEVEGSEEEGRIINGQSARQGDLPWQIGLFHTINGNRQFCGGALISNQWILTAAHCIYNAYDFQVILGASLAYDPQSGKISMGIAEAWYHPQYNPQTLNNDVAVVKLAQPVAFNNYIRPIRLARSTDYVSGNVNVYVSGWGKVHDSDPGITNQLNWVQLRTITNQQCLNYFIPQLIQNNVLCCDGSQIKSTCNGDSGGPLYKVDSDGYATHVGVVSFVSTLGCAKGYPSGYARTSSFIGFINANTGLNFP